MSAPHCLITGCELVDLNSGATAHGDLHRIGDSYVFNAVRDEFGETKWQHVEPHSPRIVYVGIGDVFERRGVVVFSVDDAALSDAAREFIAAWGLA